MAEILCDKCKNIQCRCRKERRTQCDFYARFNATREPASFGTAMVRRMIAKCHEDYEF